MKIVMLWTDALVYLLIVAGLVAAWYVRRRPHLLLPWQRVKKSAIGMVSLLVLSLFLLVGLLDTFHYRAALPEKDNEGQTVYSPEVLSAFDTLVGGLRTQVEKTYSAPLSAYLYAKESVVGADGKVVRDYPRLRFGGGHLGEPERELVGDVVTRGLIGALGGLLVGGLLGGVSSVFLRRGGVHQPHLNPPLEGEEASPLPLKGSAHNSLPFKGRAGGGMVDTPTTTKNPVKRALALTTLTRPTLIGATISLALAYHVLGTDKVGQDVLYLSLKSIRTGLVIGSVTTLVALPFALFFGVAAGYFRGWMDDLIQYIYTVLNSIPSVLLIAASVLMVQAAIEMRADWFDTAASRADVRLLALCVILGVTSWTSLCRLLRGEAMKLREMEFIQASQAFGVSGWRILARHIVPNVMHIVLITVVIDFSSLVLAEAVLSYVGVGVDPTTISFGTMINAARLEMGRDPVVWWSLAAAFFFMLILVLAANLFADVVRDAFDPRRNRMEAA
jgi:peptide/nickel transport system permease protein